MVAHLNEVSYDGKIRVISEGHNLLVDHQSKDTHHGGTAVVELDGTLLELGLLVEVIPAEVDVSITEITDMLVSGTFNILHDSNFQKSNQGDELDEASGGDGVGSDEGGNAVGERVE